MHPFVIPAILIGSAIAGLIKVLVDNDKKSDSDEKPDGEDSFFDLDDLDKIIDEKVNAALKEAKPKRKVRVRKKPKPKLKEDDNGDGDDGDGDDGGDDSSTQGD